MRQARILCAALHNPSDEPDPDKRVDINRDNVLAMLDRADAYDPDIVVFPEAALQHASNSMLDDVAEPVPGPSTDAVAEKARALDSYVVLPLYERDGGAFYNAAALINPDGEVEGTFRKLAPTVAEMDAGIAPGSEVPTWETPFGTVGIAICWDNRYPEVGRLLAVAGVDLLVYPTHGTGDRMNRLWAQYNGYHVVLCDKNDARVYTPHGDVVAHNGAGWKNPAADDVAGLSPGARAWWLFAEVNTDCRSYSRASADLDGWPAEIQEAYPGAVQFRSCGGDGVYVVECVSDELTLDDLEAEFDMERAFAYEERTRDRVLAENPDSPLFRPAGSVQRT